MKIPNKREPKQVAMNNSTDNDFKYFMKFFKKYIAEPNSFLFNNGNQ